MVYLFTVFRDKLFSNKIKIKKIKISLAFLFKLVIMINVASKRVTKITRETDK